VTQIPFRFPTPYDIPPVNSVPINHIHRRHSTMPPAAIGGPAISCWGCRANRPGTRRQYLNAAVFIVLHHAPRGDDRSLRQRLKRLSYL